MGLPRAGATGLDNIEKRFSDNVLKVELSGPEHNHLSVVDVPGLFHSMLTEKMHRTVAYREIDPAIYQTNEDLEIIRKLIMDYISDARTIIL